MQSAFFNRVVIAFAEILRVEPENRHAESVEERHKEVYEFVRRAHAVLRGRERKHDSVCVYVEFNHAALHHDYAYRENGKLKPERQSLFQMIEKFACRTLEIFLFQSQGFVFYHCVNKTARHA